MLDVKKDKYYQKHYGVSHDTAESMRKEAGNVCEICGRSMTRALNIEHFHFKVVAERTNDIFRPKWRAEVKPPFKGTTVHFADTKEAAILAAKKEALPLSIRGVACFSCNKGLAYFNDNPVTLRCAASYLERFAEKIRL